MKNDRFQRYTKAVALAAMAAIGISGTAMNSAEDRLASARQAARRLPLYSSALGRTIDAHEAPMPGRAVSSAGERFLATDPLEANAAFYASSSNRILRRQSETGETADLGNPSPAARIVSLAANRTADLFLLTSSNELYEMTHDQADWIPRGRVDELAGAQGDLSMMIHADDPKMVLIAGRGLKLYDALHDRWRVLLTAAEAPWISALRVSYSGAIWAGGTGGCHLKGTTRGDSFERATLEWSRQCLGGGAVTDFAFDIDDSDYVLMARANSRLVHSLDGGGNWQDLPAEQGYELPDVPVTGLSSGDGTLYAITPEAVFVTRDRGLHWMLESGTLGFDLRQFQPVADNIKQRFYVSAGAQPVRAIDNVAEGCHFALYDGSREETYMSLDSNGGTWARQARLLSGSRSNCRFVPAFCKIKPYKLISVSMRNPDGASTEVGRANTTVYIRVYENHSRSMRARGLAIDFNSRVNSNSRMPVAVVQGGTGGSTACQIARWVDVEDPTPRRGSTQGVLKFRVEDTNPSCRRKFDLAVLACGAIADNNLTSAARVISISAEPPKPKAAAERSAVCTDTPAGGGCRD